MPKYVHGSVPDMMPAGMVTITVACGASRGAYPNIYAAFKVQGLAQQQLLWMQHLWPAWVLIGMIWNILSIWWMSSMSSTHMKRMLKHLFSPLIPCFNGVIPNRSPALRYCILSPKMAQQVATEQHMINDKGVLLKIWQMFKWPQYLFWVI